MAFQILLSIVLCIAAFWYFSTKKPKNFPPGPRWYPLVGSYPQFKSLMKTTKDIVQTIEVLSKQHNTNVVGLKLGCEHFVVVSSAELIKEVFLNDVYLARPNTFFNNIRTWGVNGGVTSSNGKVWVTQRKFVVRHLQKVGYGKKVMELKITNEIEDIIKVIDADPLNVNIRRTLEISILNVLWAFVDETNTAKEDARINSLLDLLTKRMIAFDMSGGALSFFSWLRFIVPDKIGYNLILEVNSELRKTIGDVIDNHEKTWTEGKNDDLIYAYISEIKKNSNNDAQSADDYNYEQLLITCIDLFVAGGGTTSSAIDFSLFAMAKHQDVQAKVQDILDKTFERNIPIKYNDRYKVPYIEAVVTEIERLYTTVTITAPRCPSEDTILDGYTIPKGTPVLVSFHSIFTSSKYFDEPKEFRPERFLDSNGEFAPHAAFFPFALGKRKCLGDVLAKMCVFMFFVELIRNYNIYPLHNESSKKGEVAQTSGMFRKRKFPIRMVKRT